MKRFLLTFLGSALAGALIAYFLTLHFKADLDARWGNTKIPITLPKDLFMERDLFVALGSAAGIAALFATLASWLLFSAPKPRKRRR